MTTAKTATDVATILHKHLDAPISTEDARNIATALGLTVAPEKPEPGTWHLTDTERWPAYVDEGGKLHLNAGRLDDWIVFEPEDRWPALTPARMVPEAEWESLDAARATLVELDKLGVAEADRAGVLEQAARLAAHGISNEDLDKLVRAQYAPIAPPVLTEEEKVEVGKAIYRAYLDVEIDYRAEMLAIYEKAAELLAKHVGARELPGRDEVRDAISNAQSLKVPPSDIEAATDAVMALLGGGDRG